MAITQPRGGEDLESGNDVEEEGADEKGAGSILGFGNPDVVVREGRVGDGGGYCCNISYNKGLAERRLFGREATLLLWDISFRGWHSQCHCSVPTWSGQPCQLDGPAPFPPPGCRLLAVMVCPAQRQREIGRAHV